MPTINVTLKINDISNIIEQLNIQEKSKLVQILEKETWSIRFDQILRRIRGRAEQNPISEDEINREVKEVRKQRYDQSRH